MNLRIIITDPKVLQQVYTDANKYHSKSSATRDALGLLARSSIIFQPTEEPDYHQKRKALSQAFFKKKITSLIEIIKSVTMKHLKDTDDQTEINLPMFTKDLQAKIIINIALGRGHEETKFPYENADGSIE